MTHENGRSSLEFGSFLTAFPLHFISTFNYGRKIPKTEGAGGCHFSVESSYRCLEPCGEQPEYHTGQGCLRPRQHPSRNDKGTFPTFLRQFALGSHSS